jgi:magnesium-transporting ATPase (P-type)
VFNEILTVEMIKALSSVSKRSFVKITPFANPFLVVAVLCSMGLHMLLLYNKTLSSLFGVAPLAAKHWKVNHSN